jgi:hypothetical protein
MTDEEKFTIMTTRLENKEVKEFKNQLDRVLKDSTLILKLFLKLRYFKEVSLFLPPFSKIINSWLCLITSSFLFPFHFPNLYPGSEFAWICIDIWSWWLEMYAWVNYDYRSLFLPPFLKIINSWLCLIPQFFFLFIS